MIKVLKTEFKRAIFNKNFIIVLFIGIVISMLSIYYDVFRGNPEMITRSLKYMGTSYTPFTQWIGETNPNTYKIVFFFILPILAIIPHSDSYWMDKYSGFAKSAYTRTSKKIYITSKFIATFTVGGLVIIIPMLLNIYVLFMMLPSYHPSIFENFKAGKTMFTNLYYFHPYIYMLAYLTLNFLFAGLFACIGLAISPFCKLRFLVITIPYIIYISTFLLDPIGLATLTPFYFLQSESGIFNITFAPIIVLFILSLIATITIYMIGVKNDEVI